MRFAPRSHQEDMESARMKGGNIASEAGGQIWRRSNLGKSCMCCKEDRSRRQEAEAQGLRCRRPPTERASRIFGKMRRAWPAKVGGEKGV